MKLFRTLIVSAAALTLGCIADTPTDSSNTPADTGPPAGFAEVSGVIKDQNGAPVSGAAVVMPFGLSGLWGGNTDATGAFKFDAKASDFAGVSPVAVIVSKDRYLPKTYYYTSVHDGDLLALNPTGSSATRALATNEFVPSEAELLWHVGDASFGGSANSQLQTATSGTGLAFEVTQWNAQMRSQYHSATVTFVARGIQSNPTTPNYVGLFVQGGTATAYVTPAPSDAGGGFSAYSITISLPSNFGDGLLKWAILSGTTGTDYDDWEIGQVLVTFKP